MPPGASENRGVIPHGSSPVTGNSHILIATDPQGTGIALLGTLEETP